MKKVLIIILLVYICLNVFSGCKEMHRENMPDKSQYSRTNISKTQEVVFVTENNNEPDISSDKQGEGYGGGIITVQKYRSCYYSIPAPFVELVGRSIYYEWINSVDYTESAEKMVMLQFVQHFDISREQFDKANYKIAKIILDDLDGRPCLNPKDYANQISDEIYNADIIFSFDDKVINDYYLSPEYPYLYASEYDEAIEKGEYLSQTEVWVDVEQMEAEIIAKYGETEQVENNEETPEPEQTEAVTTE